MMSSDWNDMTATAVASVPAPPEPHAPWKQPRAESDDLLAVSRRIDWRFLLPNPRLEEVACFGPASSTHIAALQTFSRSLAVYEDFHATESCEREFDVVVATCPDATALRQAAERVRPGGFLYVEYDQRAARLMQYGSAENRRRSDGERLQRASDFVRAVERLGFHDVRAYWNRPGLESPTVLVPLEDRAALKHFLLGSTCSLRKAALRRGAWWLARWGLLDQFVFCFSLTARRTDCQSVPPAGS